jgi:hypothetical protein
VTAGFREALAALDAGDVDVLRAAPARDPSLVRARATRRRVEVDAVGGCGPSASYESTPWSADCTSAPSSCSATSTRTQP